MKKKLLALILVIVMLASFIPTTVLAASTTYVAFSSDIHNGASSDNSYSRLDSWITAVKTTLGTKLDNMGFCGDLGPASGSSSTFWTEAQEVMDTVKNNTNVSGNGFFVCGNHEFSPGSYSTSVSTNATAQAYAKTGTTLVADSYVLYSFGVSTYSSSYVMADSDITALDTYLKTAPTDKPIFILSHYPLHNYSYRTINGKDSVISTLNKYADTHKIIFLWGHNHTEGDSHYDTVYTGSLDGTAIKFTYAAAGCMAGDSYGSSSKVKGKGLVAAINGTNVSLSYYGYDGKAISSTSGDTTGDINITPSSSGATASGSVKVGGTVKINITNGSSSSKYTFTATSGDTSVATISPASIELAAGASGTITVTGVKAGSAAITISSGSSSYSRKATVTITVGSGSTPSTGDIDVTPSSSGVTASGTVSVGGTVKINITNGGSSEYKFTVESSDKSVATVSSESVTIAKGGSGSVTVTGVKAGTATINIKTSSGSSRKATVTITVGSGSTPSTGDVSVTPTTDNPTSSNTVAVGGSFKINIKNGSDSSSYTFTVSSGDTSVATVSPASIEIAAGASGTVTVTGVKAGSTAITISNNSKYGDSYSRKATINLTVGEGGSTPTTGDISVTPTTDNPTVSKTIAVGSSFKINLTNGSSREDYTFTVTSGNTSVATVSPASVEVAKNNGTGSVTVTGLKAGTTTIAITNNNEYGDDYSRRATINLTVGEGGGDTPVTPDTSDVNVTPTTDNPTVSKTIAVNNTFKINVTNGSSNSQTYTFYATQTNSAAASISPASVELAAGASGTITVKGLASGSTVITIKNENSYGDQYVRKATINLTVGEGGGDTPEVTETAPVFSTASVTTESPVAAKSISVKVGQAIRVAVTNGSEDDLTYTVTNASSSLVYVTPTTLNLAAGDIGYVYITGAATGSATVAISSGDSVSNIYAALLTVTVNAYDADDMKHTPADPVKEVEVAATCDEEGSCDVVIYCTGHCTEQLSRETVVEPALGHDFDEPEWTWTAEKDDSGKVTGYKAILTLTCQRLGCDEEVVKKATVTSKTIEATETDPETIVYTASVEYNGDKYSATKEVVPGQFKLTFETNGGSDIVEMEVDGKDTIDLSVYVPKKTGCKFIGWYLDEALTKPVSELSLTEDTTVYARWLITLPTVIVPFKDVKPTDWFYSDVRFVYANNLMTGTADTTFAPTLTVDRGMIVFILYRLEGCPEVTSECPYTDVKSGIYYEDAVTWATECGIVSGYGRGMFGAEDNITREQLARILYGYAKYKGYNISTTISLDSFNDGAKVSAWALPEMKWAVASGLIAGDSSKNLNPQGKASRAEAAAILHRFCDYVID